MPIDQSQGLLQLLQGLVSQPTPTPTPDPFMQQFARNRVGDPDKLYARYLRSVHQPPMVAGPPPETGLLATLINLGRTVIPYVDSPIGHQDLLNSVRSYPFVPQTGQFLQRNTVVRDSMKPEVVEEEAETSPEKVFGLIPTGRDKTTIATKLDYSPPMSVMTHEMMHSYLDAKGYPKGEAQFDEDWEATKKHSGLLKTIDRYLATSPDYKDEQNRTDLSQERYAYLAQALSGGGIDAFPLRMRKHYAPVFGPKNASK